MGVLSHYNPLITWPGVAVVILAKAAPDRGDRYPGRVAGHGRHTVWSLMRLAISGRRDQD